jgi:hypothetical protein
MRTAIRIVVAANSRIHAELLAEVVQRDRTIQVVGCASSSREVFEIAAKSLIAFGASWITGDHVAGFRQASKRSERVSCRSEGNLFQEFSLDESAQMHTLRARRSDLGEP